jgi:putative ABC transport system substrate-binding protein
MAARGVDMEPRVRRVADRTEFEAAFRAFRGQGVTAAISPYWFLYFEDPKVLTRLALDCRIALVDQIQPIAGAGALLSYQADYREITRRMAVQIDKILRGVPLREIPFEQPTRFRLEINRATARALGLAIPPELLLLADKVHD